MVMSGIRRTAGDAATEWAFASGWQAIRYMPEFAARRFFQEAADAAWLRHGRSIRQLERNLARVHPELSDKSIRSMSMHGMRSYMRYWCEAFRLPSYGRDRIRRDFALHDQRFLDEAMASGTGALMVVNHGGNWDLAGAWAALTYGSVTTVAERLKPEGLFEKFLAYRRSLGMEILPLGDSATFRTLAARLRAGGLVALVGDRDISRNGIEVDLLGQIASLPAGPALLAQLTGAPLYPVTLWFDGPMARGTIHPRIEVPVGLEREEATRAVTQAIADSFAVGLRDHAVDWHMLQPVWTADLDVRRRGDRS